jgi:hypothetical protein
LRQKARQFDILYPKENRRLVEQRLALGGAIIYEVLAVEAAE